MARVNSLASHYGELISKKSSGAQMPNKYKFFMNQRVLSVSMILVLLASGFSAKAAGILNTPSSGYLICVNSKTKVVTHPGTSTCAKGTKKLTLGAQGAQGLTGAAGLNGVNGKDGRDGKDGKTLWNGVKDPENTWGAPGDMFINSVTKTLFGPKNLDGTWPAGVSLVGPKGDQGPIGLTGPMGPQVQVEVVRQSGRSQRFKDHRTIHLWCRRYVIVQDWGDRPWWRADLLC